MHAATLLTKELEHKPDQEEARASKSHFRHHESTNCAGYSSHSEAEKSVTGLKELRLGKKGKGPGLVLEYSFYYGRVHVE